MKLGLMLRYSGATVDFPIDLIKRAEKLAYDSVWPRARTRWRAAALGRRKRTGRTR